MSGHRGVKNQFSKLTEMDVRVMRALYGTGLSPYCLAKIFGVSRPQVKRIVLRQKWAWLE